LRSFFRRFRSCFKTRTRDISVCASRYWRGLLTMEDQRNYANIERRLEGTDGQQLQQFMSHSPWSAAAVYERVQEEIKADPRLARGGLLIADETADAKAGEKSAGAGRQHNGRLGKVDLCQVATCLSFVHPGSGLWTLVDNELFVPEHWFSPEYAPLRQEVGLPPERTFQTKPQLALAMIQRAVQRGLPFERVAADDLYGRNRAFRAGLGCLPYALEVPRNTPIALSPQREAFSSPGGGPVAPDPMAPPGGGARRARRAARRVCRLAGLDARPERPTGGTLAGDSARSGSEAHLHSAQRPGRHRSGDPGPGQLPAPLGRTGD
jgi:SRSO17 transposase